MLPATVLALCTVAMAAPVPNPQAVPFIDINASNNKLDFPINVLGLQTHDVSAANGNLSPGQAAAPAAASPAPVAQSSPATTTESPNAKGVNGNTLNFPINVLGAQTHDISAFNGNLSPNQRPAAVAAPQVANVQGVPAAAAAPQAANAPGGSNNASYVIPTTAATVSAVAAPQNGLIGAISSMTSALYNLAGAITGTLGGQV